MNGYLTTPLEFLVNTLFQLYILTVMLRFLLQWARASFYNPVCQFLVKVTNPALKPLRRVIPGLFGLDMAAVVLMFVLQLVAVFLVVLLRGSEPALGPLLVLAATELVELALNVYIFSILIQAILSWVNPGHYNPVAEVLNSLTEPVLRPIRRRMPMMSGLDFSPLVAILALQVLKMLVMPPLRYLAAVAS